MQMTDEDMRRRADWMNPKDDEILEYLSDVIGSSPQDVAESLDSHQKYVNERLIILYKYGLLDRPSRGLYRINENTREYLNEELDASTLEREE